MTDVEKKILYALVQEYGMYEIAETINKIKCTTHDAIRTDKHVDYKSHEHDRWCYEGHKCVRCKYNDNTCHEYPCTHCGESGKCYWVAK